jgi:hypothetical protein
MSPPGKPTSSAFAMLLDRFKRNVLLATLDERHEDPVQPGDPGQPLLGNAIFCADRP